MLGLVVGESVGAGVGPLLAMKSKAEVGASVGPLVDDSVGSEVIGTELDL